MKKFLVLSAVVGLAGIGVGLAARQSDPEPSTTVIETATDATTTNSTAIAQPIATSPTTRSATKTVVKSTASTSRAAVPAVVAATSSTTRPLATTTTTTAAALAPTCAVAAANSSVHKGDTQTISVVSNMPTAKTRLTIQYPKFDTGRPNPRLEYTLTTDGDGSVSKIFSVSETSTVSAPVIVQFYDSAGHLVPGCQTSFEAR